MSKIEKCFVWFINLLYKSNLNKLLRYNIKQFYDLWYFWSNTSIKIQNQCYKNIINLIQNVYLPCHLIIDNTISLFAISFTMSSSSFLENMHKPFDMVSFFYFIVLHIFLLLCPGKCYMGSFYAIHFTFETDGDLFSFSKNKMHVYCLFCGKRVYRTISSSLDHRLWKRP